MTGRKISQPGEEQKRKTSRKNGQQMAAKEE